MHLPPRAARHLPLAGGAWSEVTTKPYQNDNPDYRDPVWSNSGAGWGLVSGRVTSLAVDGSDVYAGTADGGVWKSSDGGSTWQPLLDGASSLSIGAVAVNPDDDRHRASRPHIKRLAWPGELPLSARSAPTGS